jgi:hypothetical protein
MAISKPIIGSVTLPHLSEYSESVGFRGGHLILASGSVVYDVVNTSAKRTFRLSWKALTTTEKDDVMDAYNLLKISPASYVGPEGGTPVQVTRSEQQGELDWESVSVSNGQNGQILMWSTTLMLREV